MHWTSKHSAKNRCLFIVRIYTLFSNLIFKRCISLIAIQQQDSTTAHHQEQWKVPTRYVRAMPRVDLMTTHSHCHVYHALDINNLRLLLFLLLWYRYAFMYSSKAQILTDISFSIHRLLCIQFMLYRILTTRAMCSYIIGYIKPNLMICETIIT